MGCHLREVLIPAVISALLLWGGVQCRAREYSLEVPPWETVQEGGCVCILCRFTYPTSLDDQHAQLYGYWYAEDKQSRQPRLVATNNPRRIQEIDPQVRRRFEMSGPKLNSGDCSLTINDAQAADLATYHFQMEKGHKRWSYSAAKEKVPVIVTERILDIITMEPMTAGQRASITSKYERCSSSGDFVTSWTYPTAYISVLNHFQTENGNSVADRMEFIPTADANQKNVTCKITYGEKSNRRSIEKTVVLNIQYAPRILPFSGHLQAPRGDVRTFSNVSNGQVYAWAHESILVRCEADANPPSSQTWVRTPSHSSRLHISNNEFKISGLRLEDKGKYECQATNQEGTSRASFDLHVQDPNDFIKG